MFQSLQTWTHFLDPMRAEVRVQVTWEGHPQGEVRGRILGPMCPFATTIEIAYPLQIVEAKPGNCLLKGVIPEPSLWEPETAFFYAVVVELWEGSQRVAKDKAIHEFRAEVPRSFIV